MAEFKVGDIVTGTPESDKKYNITTSEMKRGLVVKTDGERIMVMVLTHERKEFRNHRYWANANYFKKIGRAKIIGKVKQ